jgi:hypothetical protein
MSARSSAIALLFVACRKEPAPTHVELPTPLPVSPTTSVTAAIASAPPPPRGPLFPEDPTLDDTEPTDALFAQETWTGATTWQQHCREWGLTPSREVAERDRINTLLAARGIHLPDHTREKGVVVSMGSNAVGVVDHGPQIKLVVCTENVAPKSAHDAFTARVLSSPRAPVEQRFAALGEPDVAWRRVHVTGEIEIGLRYAHPPSADALRAVDAVKDAHDTRFNAKMRGADLWWTGLEKP